MGWLYNHLRHLFIDNDGSYPEVCVCKLSTNAVSQGYSFLREIADFVVGAPVFFDRETNREVLLDAVENAAQMVCEGTGQPFHFMLRGLKQEPGKVFELGIFIFANAIAFDYEKGPHWGEREIEAFMRILLKIKDSSPDAFIKLEEDVSPEDSQLFNDSLQQLAQEIAAEL